MKIPNKALLFAGISLFIFAGTVFASSSASFFTQAKQFVNNNCFKKTISDQTSLFCYLFEKTEEYDKSFTTVNATLTPIPSQIAGIQTHQTQTDQLISTLQTQVTSLSASTSPQPTPPLKGLAVDVSYVANDHNIEVDSFVVDKDNNKVPTEVSWGTAHFPGSDLAALSRSVISFLYFNFNTLNVPPDGTQIPIDMYGFWGGATIPFHFVATWQAGTTQHFQSF